MRIQAIIHFKQQYEISIEDRNNFLALECAAKLSFMIQATYTNSYGLKLLHTIT